MHLEPLGDQAVLAYCADELDRCHRHERTMILLMMDLDHFKRINDTYGHLAGDKVIMDFSSRVESMLRRVDRLGRYGGEEFVVLLPETTSGMAAIVAERIRQAAANATEVTPYTVSIGLAASNKADRSVHEILERADAALYRAKEGGRNRIELAE
jgi:diguanylate cyclase (GGDEF)-like protein